VAACKAPAEAGGFTFVKVATWRDDAVSAYSMIHDDLCGGTLRGIDQNAAPALLKRGLTAAMGPYVEACESGKLWDMVKDLESKGIEIINHSWSHPHINAGNAVKEIVMAKQTFDQHVKNPLVFFIFPFDEWNAATIGTVKSAGHLGARASRAKHPPLNTEVPDNDFALEFDVWPRAYSDYGSVAPNALLNHHVQQAIMKKGWAIREMHSVTPAAKTDGSEGWEPVPLALYEAHLDFLVKAAKANQVWTATPTTILRYRHARAACKAQVQGNMVTFDASSDECRKYATPISVIVKSASDVPSVAATQNGVAVSTRKIAPGTFSINAEPTAGSVALAGCADPGPGVDTSIQLPFTGAAQSVCELETVVARPGRSDDFEGRGARGLKASELSLPAAGAGAWSWYPARAEVSAVADGGDHALRVSGRGLGEWSGVTLAFARGSSCYDAGATQGVRFKIRGRVESNDGSAGAVVLSVVSAETQPQSLGGDALRAGGHFHRLVTVGPQWTTVSVAWRDLLRPSWGDQTRLGALAVSKLQALNWSIDQTARDFAVDIDDVELF
jgi:hypothetical protein